MSEYSSTVHLPDTAFPMRAKLAEREPLMLEKWQSSDLYHKLISETEARPAFHLHDGPPYANGHIHIGHALNKILKDIITKSKLLEGYQTPMIPGWDCHGLPIEIAVEKKLAKAKKKLEPKDFREACRTYAASQVAVQCNDFQRLGILGDWSNPYLTMNKSYEAEIIRSLATVIDQGHLLRGKKPVHWCTDCGSALAEAEVEYAEKTSFAIDVGFRLLNVADFEKALDQKLTNEQPCYFPIWTTTPWTLLANEAVCIHPELNYALINTKINDHQMYVVVAEDLLESVSTRLGFNTEVTQVLSVLPGEALTGLQCQHPFLDKAVPVIEGDHVTTEAGTGLVHTAPSHGQEDFLVGQRFDLPVECPVEANGCFSKDTPFVGGQYYAKAEPMVLELLRDRGCLFAEDKIQHSYPHCWRHKKPLIFRAAPQWFISMDQAGLRQQALDMIDQVNWVPAWGEDRIKNMISTRPDWCISRQRLWGTPMALCLSKTTGELHPRVTDCMRKVADRIEKEGLEAWYSLSLAELIGEEEAEGYEKTTDVLDVWFDSGVSHQCVMSEREDGSYPADIYLEGSDQHRGWFQSSLLTACAMKGKAPYKTVITHGYVLDGQGRKMSKSLGNVVAPKDVVDTYGADVLRFWVASADYRGDVSVSKDVIARAADAYRRIRNTARYLLANCHDFDYAKHAVELNQMSALDRYALRQAYLVGEEIVAAYRDYDFSKVTKCLQNFCVLDLGGFYLDVIKDRQYTLAQNATARRAAQTVMYMIASALVRWIAPILSYTAEEYYEHLAKEDDRLSSVFMTTWDGALPEPSDEALLTPQEWEQLLGLRSAVNQKLEQARKQDGLRGTLDAEVWIALQDKALFDVCQKIGDELRYLFIVSSVHLVSEADFKASFGSDEQSETNTLALSGAYVAVKPHQAPKCERCWHHELSVGEDQTHPSVCHRCIKNMAGKDEQRIWF